MHNVRFKALTNVFLNSTAFFLGGAPPKSMSYSHGTKIKKTGELAKAFREVTTAGLQSCPIPCVKLSANSTNLNVQMGRKGDELSSSP